MSFVSGPVLVESCGCGAIFTASTLRDACRVDGFRNAHKGCRKGRYTVAEIIKMRKICARKVYADLARGGDLFPQQTVRSEAERMLRTYMENGTTLAELEDYENQKEQT